MTPEEARKEERKKRKKENKIKAKRHSSKML